MAFIMKPEPSIMHCNGLKFNGQDSLVQPLLTDFYQITMCYGYWKSGMHDEPAVFDLFFRRNPFHGEYTIFAGLEDCLRFVQNFHFSDSDLEYLRTLLPDSSEEFFEYLAGINCKKLKIFGIKEGSVVFPRVPLITVEGPLAICQLLETTFLNLVNYASLVATNASRFRNVAGKKVQLLEFGLRRAQGPNGGLTASKFCYIGGFDATSNVLAGKLFGIPVRGTQAHSFVSAFSSAAELKIRSLSNANGKLTVDFLDLCQQKLKFLMSRLSWGADEREVSVGELCSFCSYAIAFPREFVALIDTYDVLKSGVINFCAVALALHELGYRALGCRLDSGDLSYLSKEVRARFRKIAAMERGLEWMAELAIVASNDINEDTILSLNEQKHEVNIFGVGTHLVTCQRQPALGCVFKLVAVSGSPRIKLSAELNKITIPGWKTCYRLYGKEGYGICDLMTLRDEEAPQPDEPILCRHPFLECKRARVLASKVEKLQLEYWINGEIAQTLPSLDEMKQYVDECLSRLRKDHCRFLNPTPYKVSVSEKLYDFLHSIWMQNAPIGLLE